MPGEAPGFPADSDRDEEVDVLYLAGQRPAGPGEWLLITAVEGPPGADFLARVLPAGGQHAHGGDVLVHLAPEPGNLEPLSVRVSAWAVLNGLLIAVARWDRQDPDGWPEQVRATATFAMGVLTEMEDHGADLGAYDRVDLEAAAGTATAGVPAGVTSGRACRAAQALTLARQGPAGAGSKGRLPPQPRSRHPAPGPLSRPSFALRTVAPQAVAGAGRAYHSACTSRRPPVDQGGRNRRPAANLTSLAGEAGSLPGPREVYRRSMEVHHGPAPGGSAHAQRPVQPAKRAECETAGARGVMPPGAGSPFAAVRWWSRPGRAVAAWWR
jgi:hypothetical protein